MKIHPREKLVHAASTDFSGFMIEFLRKHSELTYGELFTILAEELARTSKYAVKAERETDKDSDDGRGEPMCSSCHRCVSDSPAGGCETPKEHG